MQQLPTYYINLLSRPDRRTFMENQFARLGLTAERCEATRHDDPRVIAATGKHRSTERPNGLTAAELACSLSHEAIWRTALDRNEPLVAIFEDDAVLSAALPDFLAKVDGAAYEAIHIETEDRRLRVLPVTQTVLPGVCLRPYLSTLHGAAGYLISRAGMHTMLASKTHLAVPVDHALFCPLRSPLRRQALTDPGLCIQMQRLDANASISQSSIVEAGTRPQHPLNVRLYIKWLDSRRTLAHLASIPKGLQRKHIEFRAA
ncbi:MAG TPA: glycosyltransferase family 25 protein [Nitrococcus sp.]|jgi:GR25 family glycosyltransferase involved in LPS biosynthesis|nr:glycosyltransferase family 25 protein [Nitrococcus sp.]